MSTFTTPAGEQLVVERGAAGTYVVSFRRPGDQHPLGSLNISEPEWAALTADVDTDRPVCRSALDELTAEKPVAAPRRRVTVEASNVYSEVGWALEQAERLSGADRDEAIAAAEERARVINERLASIVRIAWAAPRDRA